ncbi:MAG: SLAC1 anion channel family protein [Salinivirgaceae bacterium]
MEFKEKIKHFPITLYSVVMGLSGLTIALSKFDVLDWLPSVFYTLMLWVVATLFVFISLNYLAKALWFFPQVKEDFKHRIRINFFSAISISLLLISVAFHHHYIDIARVLWWVGVVLHTYLMLHTISFWINHNFEIKTFNPAWFIPVVGNIIVPIMGVEFMPMQFSYFYFSIGFFFWIILFTIFLNRVVFHDQMPQKFIPTLFILIAPPAVGFLAYYRITGAWDLFAMFLLNMSYFFVLLLLFLYRSFRKLKFYISWWAFTFPLDAITIASVTAYQITGQTIFKFLSFGFLTITLLVIFLVTIKTVQLMAKGELCVEEE